MKLRALDLFSGSGGACIGMQQAGFEVFGVDIKKHKKYPGHFIQADIYDLPFSVFAFDFIWASPPCQRYSIGTFSGGKDQPLKHPDLIPITREILFMHPFTCIENNSRAPIRKDLELTGPSVGLEYIQRRRYFELSFKIKQPPAPNVSREVWNSGEPITVWTSMSATNKHQRDRRKRLGLPLQISKTEAKEKMGIPQHYDFTNKGIGNAVAPPMAKYIADEVMKQIKNKYL